MKLFVESFLPIAPDVAWEVFESDEFRARLASRASIRQTVIEEREEGNILYRTVRTEPERELPSVVASLLGAAKLTYVQKMQFDREKSRMDWTVHLEVMSDKVDVKGATTVSPDGDDGSRRVVDGDITVRVPLVGKRIEKVVVAEFEKSMKRAAEVAMEIVEERGLA